MKQKKQQAILEVINRQARNQVLKERMSIVERVTMLMCYSMLQCGISAEDVKKVKKMAETAAVDKFQEMRAEGVAEEWLRVQLEEEGIHFDPIPEDQSIDTFHI